MKIAFLGSETSWYLADLQRAAAKVGNISIEAISFAGLGTVSINGLTPVAKVGDDAIWKSFSRQSDLNEFDAILVRTMAASSLEQVIFRMDLLGHLERSETLILNSAKCLEISVDKYRSIALMRSAGIPVPHTAVCQDLENAFQAFDDFGQDVVVKPIFGSEGRGVVRVQNRNIAEQVFRNLLNANRVVYFQKFLDHGGSDVRIFVMGDKHFSMTRSANRTWKTNLSQGGRSFPYAATQREIDMARKACDSVGAKIGGVDIIYENDDPYILEVNAVPGWKGLAKVLNLDIASELLRYVSGLIECK